MQWYLLKLDNTKRGIPSQGPKLTYTFDPMAQNSLITNNYLHMKFKNDLAKPIVCIVSIRLYRQSSKVDL